MEQSSALTADAAAMGRVEAAIMGESALIDRETGRVFWEGGASSTLSESIFAANLDKFGAEHAQSVLLTTFITIAFLGILAGWLRQIIRFPPNGYDEASSRVVQLAFMILSEMLGRIPRFKNKWLVTATIALYFLESYNCETRRFLANALSSPSEVEQYIEHLRSQPPIVTWMVRSFHYRKRRIFSFGDVLQSVFRKMKSQGGESFPSAPLVVKKCSPSFPFTKRVITHEATASYQFHSVVDNTIAGIWRRSDAVSLTSAPFTRIVLNKLLVLKDGKTREDYFRQQSEFVTEHGRGDEFTEFSTDIQVPGYRPRMLAVRSIPGITSAKIFRLHLFWLFTLCGMSLPYRIWFKRHCDSLRVTIVKETSATASSSSSYWGYPSRWMPIRASMEPYVRNYSAFRDYMKRRSLYGSEEEVSTKQSEAPVGTGEIELMSGDLSQASPGTDMEVPFQSISNDDPYDDTAASSETPMSPDT